jgi:hypothetical protein
VSETIVYLKHLSGSKAGQIDSFDSDRIRVGRQPDNDLRSDPEKEREVSGYHAEIYREGDSFWVKDLQSRNGTFVNGRRISEPTLVAPGDAIQFAPHGPKVTLFTKSPSSDTAVMPAHTGEPSGPATSRTAGLRRLGVIALLATGCLALVAGLAYLAWSSRWVLFSVLCGGMLTSGGVLAWRWAGWPSPVRLFRRAPKERAPLAADAQADDEQIKELHRKWQEALATLRKGPGERRGAAAGHAAPWFLVLGETGAGMTETIRAANPLSWL